MRIADVISNLLRFGIQFGFFIIVYIIYSFVALSIVNFNKVQKSFMDTVYLIALILDEQRISISYNPYPQ